MHKAQQQVQDFHRDVIGAPTSPAEPAFRDPHLRAKLILEEAIETAIALVGSRQAAEILVDQGLEAQILATTHSGFEINDDPEDVQQPNFLSAIDGLCDTIVVCYGTAEAMGIDLEPFYDEVMRSNMAKKGGPVREDGKHGKPFGWTPPNLKQVFADEEDRRLRGAKRLSRDVPAGYRDLYWCWHQNEPIIAYGDRKCTACGAPADEDEDGHTFMEHILKPRGAK